MFVPVSIKLGAGGHDTAVYDRMIETSSRFDMLATRAEDMSEPLGMIGADLRAQVEAAFATQGATGATGPWTVLSEPYGSWKQAHVPGVPTLVGLRPVQRGTHANPTRPQTYTISGEMKYQLLDPLATHISPRRMLYAPTSDIAGYHETGTPNMPARPPIDLSLPFLHSIDRTFTVWLAKLMKETGL